MNAELLTVLFALVATAAGGLGMVVSARLDRRRWRLQLARRGSVGGTPPRHPLPGPRSAVDEQQPASQA